MRLDWGEIGENSGKERGEPIPLAGNELYHLWRLPMVADLEVKSRKLMGCSGVFLRSGCRCKGRKPGVVMECERNKDILFIYIRHI